MTHCRICGNEVDFEGLYYAIKKNGNKTGSKQVGFLCADCGSKLENKK